MTANTSAIRQHFAHTTDKLTSPIQESYKNKPMKNIEEFYGKVQGNAQASRKKIRQRE